MSQGSTSLDRDSRPTATPWAPQGDLGAAEGLSLADGQHDALALQPTLGISVVVPCYNPGARLRPTIDRLLHVLDSTGLSYEVIIVSDGSTDGSAQTVEGLPDSVVRLVAYAPNVGKGHALRTGLRMARGRYVGFIDADGDISPDILIGFLDVIGRTHADVVVGSKRHPDSSVHWTPLRRLYSWAHQHLNRALFRLDVKDTQVGIKLMERRVLADVLPLSTESRFAFDIELLALAHRFGHQRIVEAPVRIEERTESTVSVKRAWGLLADTVHLFARLTVRHGYDAALSGHEAVGHRPESRPISISASDASGVATLGLGLDSVA